jgi:hypothetical protein
MTGANLQRNAANIPDNLLPLSKPGVNENVSALSAQTPAQNSGSSVFEFSPEYREWRDRNTVMGIKYYGRNRVYDGPRLTKLSDFVDACKVPIVVFAFCLVMGLVGIFELLAVGTLGLSLLALVYLILFLTR